MTTAAYRWWWFTSNNTVKIPRTNMIQHLVFDNSNVYKNPISGVWELVDYMGDEIRPIQQGRCWDFNGTDNYIEIIGLLTTDTIEVPTGATLPTCTVDDRLDCVAGKTWNIKIIRDGVVLWYFTCDETAGNTARSIDLAHKTTTINGTLTTFHAIDNSITSRHNDIGYATKTGVDGLIPLDLHGEPCLADCDTIYSGRVKYNCRVEKVNYLYLNGTNNYFSITPILFEIGDTISFYTNFYGISSTQYFIGGVIKGRGIRYNGSNFLISNGGTLDFIDYIATD
jgi:hypothetical protein